MSTAKSADDLPWISPIWGPAFSMRDLRREFDSLPSSVAPFDEVCILSIDESEVVREISGLALILTLRWNDLDIIAIRLREGHRFYGPQLHKNVPQIESLDLDPTELAFVLEGGKLRPNYTIPMILNCPSCGARHIDEQNFAEVAHHTHACQMCGHVWRPAKVNTHGVQFLPGYRNPITE